jgi:hypothetical protein
VRLMSDSLRGKDRRCILVMKRRRDILLSSLTIEVGHMRLGSISTSDSVLIIM